MNKYPAYKHDDVFYFEYEFAMMLLEIIKHDVDHSREYSSTSKQLNNAKPKR